MNRNGNFSLVNFTNKPFAFFKNLAFINFKRTKMYKMKVAIKHASLLRKSIHQMTQATHLYLRIMNLYKMYKVTVPMKAPSVLTKVTHERMEAIELCHLRVKKLEKNKKYVCCIIVVSSFQLCSIAFSETWVPNSLPMRTKSQGSEVIQSTY